MEYLPQGNRVGRDLDTPPINAAGKHVIIIGGGDTGGRLFGHATAKARCRSRCSTTRAAARPDPG